MWGYTEVYMYGYVLFSSQCQTNNTTDGINNTTDGINNTDFTTNMIVNTDLSTTGMPSETSSTPGKAVISDFAVLVSYFSCHQTPRPSLIFCL